MTVTVEPATALDAVELAELMRQPDRLEVARGSGLPPYDAIMDSIAGSVERWAVRVDGDLIAIWGVGDSGKDSILGPRVGVAWMLTSELCDLHRKTFWRLCKDGLHDLFDRWDLLCNAIDAHHAQAVRWALRLGFRLAPATPWGVCGEPFHVFTVTREDVRV